jgi:hypothetical protein
VVAMELDPAAEEEEYRLEAHNEEQDARAFLGIDNDDAPGAGTSMGSTSPTVASSNQTAMYYLKPLFPGYLGALTDVDEDELSSILHQHCACHIINLIVKSGLKRVKHYLEDFRNAINFLNS